MVRNFCSMFLDLHTAVVFMQPDDWFAKINIEVKSVQLFYLLLWLYETMCDGLSGSSLRMVQLGALCLELCLLCQ